MKLALQKVTTSGGSWADVEERGTLRESMDKKDFLFFSRKNLESDKRVALLIRTAKDPEGAPLMLSLSEQLSRTVRKAFAQKVKVAQILRALIDLRVIENDKGLFLIPDAVASEGSTFEDLVKAEAVTLDDIIG